MSALTSERVLAEAAAWVWVPEGAPEVVTEEFRIIGYPAYFTDPTVACAIDSSSPAAELVDAVLAAARRIGRTDGVTFRGLSDSVRPGDLEDLLVARGARLVETLAVLALDLAEPRPPLDVPDDVELVMVRDLDTARAFDGVTAVAFDGTPQSEDELARTEAGVDPDETPRFVALLDGRPVGAAGSTVAGDVLRLWGGAVLPEARHRGVYRALLEQRLRLGRERGLTIALVKGRVETSAPTLRRAGFAEFGGERAYHLSAEQWT